VQIKNLQRLACVEQADWVLFGDVPQGDLGVCCNNELLFVHPGASSDFLRGTHLVIEQALRLVCKVANEHLIATALEDVLVGGGREDQVWRLFLFNWPLLDNFDFVVCSAQYYCFGFSVDEQVG